MLTNYLALDVGEARIGLAVANSVAKIASPLPAIPNDDQVIERLRSSVEDLKVAELVVGWPRGMSGQETDQTRYVADFIKRLKEVITIPITEQDEALTSVKAEAELSQRQGPYTKGDVDSLSAVYILEDFIASKVH